MNEYLLFIDTEASGLPKKWDLPYTVPGNWPYAVQVSWLIYSREGQKLKEQNIYISNNDFAICATALRIHGLTKDFLQQNGIPRCEALALLSKDLDEFRPMIVGHFIELDYHIIGADYYRADIENPMENLPAFCIMKASQHLQQNPHNKFLRLGDLYQILFKKPLLNQHNALTDAGATADCFFELVKRNEIKSFAQPPIVFQKKEVLPKMYGWMIAILLILFIALLINHYYG
ncbi:MAG: 3'-5' exonuclease [Ferruginibacter sp.]